MNARFWRKEDDRIVCELCPRHCRLKAGQRAFCYVRQATEDGMNLTTYGRSSGFCIDPIEKKPLNHFLPGTPVLSFGTAGCNLGCKFCQNHDISKARDTDKLMEKATPEMIAAAAKHTGCRSVAYTYNDPVIFAEYAIDTALACREQEIKNVVVSAGYITDRAREEFFAPMNAANIDLKAFSETFYHKLTASHLQPVLDTLVYLVHETNVWVEITTLIIPGKNDSEEETTAMCEWIGDNLGLNIPLHFTAYHPDYKMTAPRTPERSLLNAVKIARKTGIEHVYTGNIHHPETASTWCKGCGKILIERDWHALGRWNLTANGKCNNCHEPLAGIFEERPGTWGRKRRRISWNTA